MWRSGMRLTVNVQLVSAVINHYRIAATATAAAAAFDGAATETCLLARGRRRI